MANQQSDEPVSVRTIPTDLSSSPALRRLIEEVRIESEKGSGQQSGDRGPHSYNRQHNRHNR